MEFDAAVIGGGILGCMCARSLRRWNISTVLLEKEADVCLGITRANSAIVYPGYDNKPGSLKAELTVRGNAQMEALCKELEVAFHRCGSLLVTYDEASVPRLRKKLEAGIANGVPGLEFLTGEQAEAMEPMLRKGVVAALYAPGTGTVNPWQLGIAALENAVQNGARVMKNAEVTAITKTEEGFLLDTAAGKIRCKMVFNCAGLFADRVQKLIYDTPVGLKLDGAEYLVFDTLAPKPERIIFHQADRCGKGITAIPCTEGNLLISGVRKDFEVPFGTTPEGLRQLYQDTGVLLPEADLSQVIRSFGAVRPNPYTENGENLPDLNILNPHPGFYSLVGVKTPGLTCAHQLGLLLARKAADYLQAEENRDFDPIRKGIPREGSHIVCRCEQITREQILEAIRRGATTVEGVKRRVGSGMGRCQGSRCAWEIGRLLEEYGNGTR